MCFSVGRKTRIIERRQKDVEKSCLVPISNLGPLAPQPHVPLMKANKDMRRNCRDSMSIMTIMGI